MSEFTGPTATVARPPTNGVNTRFCRECGTGLSLQARFCSGCGTPVQVHTALCSVPAAPPVASYSLESRPRSVTPHIWGAIICSIVAVFLLPPVFGGIAIFLGYKVRKQNADLGTALMVVAGGAAVLGMILSAIATGAA